VNGVEFISDRFSYIVLRGRWLNIIVENVHAPSEEKSDESKVQKSKGVRSLPEISYENVTRRLMQKWRERIFSSQQIDRRVSIRIVMIMGLD